MKPSLTWLLDTQVIPLPVLGNLKEAILNSQINLIECNLKVAKPQLPPEPFIPYGSTHLIRLCLESNLLHCHLFYNDNFTTQEWVKHLGTSMLNHDAYFCTLAEAINLPLTNFFIKPDSDLKSFTGSVVQKEGLQRFINKVAAGEFAFDLSLPVVVSPTHNTGWEWRLVLIKDQVIASSSYKLKSMLNLTKPVPEAVIDFAQRNASKWHPAEVYVMDVGETEQGLKIVEFNCFNASGLYNCDTFKIVNKVNELLLK